jgi:hypothetical protein
VAVVSARADRAVTDALELISLVRDLDPALVHERIGAMSRPWMEATCIALAAMVPVDQTPAELLAWCDPDLQRREADRRRRILRAAKATRNLRPHGTHAAYARHKTNGTVPCDLCVAAERTYQRDRKRRLRAAA